MLHASTMHVTCIYHACNRHVTLNMHVKNCEHACYIQQILTRDIFTGDGKDAVLINLFSLYFGSGVISNYIVTGNRNWKLNHRTE